MSKKYKLKAYLCWVKGKKVAHVRVPQQGREREVQWNGVRTGSILRTAPQTQELVSSVAWRPGSRRTEYAKMVPSLLNALAVMGSVDFCIAFRRCFESCIPSTSGRRPNHF